jgi:uncharacterized protein YndB with AHSA1/START domain
MPDIFHNFTIKSSPEKVFENICRSEGLDNWWTKNSVAKPEKGGEYLLDFGPQYRWKAVVSKYETNQIFELQFTDADADWIGSKVGFSLKVKNGNTDVYFYHSGWPQVNEHFKISSYCWAMYLRILKRYTEKVEQVPYEKRLDV